MKRSAHRKRKSLGVEEWADALELEDKTNTVYLTVWAGERKIRCSVLFHSL